MITISRQAFTGGEQIARLLAHDLGWKLLDNEAVEGLLEQEGFPHREAAAFEERKPGLWHRFSSERDKYLHFLKLVSSEFAREGDCVILGRGGQILFADVPGVFRVRVIAPPQDRIANARATSAGDERRAWQAVQHSDNERAGFHRFLFNVNWDHPELYDLVVNTHRISPKTAAAMIVKAMGAEETGKKRRETSRRLAHRALVQKAMIEILYRQKLPIHWLDIDTADGVITLKGTAQDRPSIERGRDIAAEVLGVDGAAIRNEISFTPRYVEALGGIHLGAVS